MVAIIVVINNSNNNSMVAAMVVVAAVLIVAEHLRLAGGWPVRQKPKPSRWSVVVEEAIAGVVVVAVVL